VLYSITEKKNDQLKRRIGPQKPIRLEEPRISPQDESEWDEDAKILLGRWREINKRPTLNINATLARHSKLLKRWSVFSNHVLFKSSLPVRDREILILRIGWLCRSKYEWGQHVIIGKIAGLKNDEIKRIQEGPDATGWNSFEATLLRAVDELYIDAFISDATWEKLTEHYNTKQIMDLIFTVGQYNLVSMTLNTLGVQLEKELEEKLKKLNLNL